MWNFEKIPKIVHFYWGNEKISFLRYLSVLSFRKFNPDWRIIIHFPNQTGTLNPTWGSGEQGKNIQINQDYLEELEEIPNIEFIEHDISSYGFPNGSHEVHKSDFLRWILLSTYGGVWSDFDIIYTSSINNLKENIKDNSNKNIALCKYRFGSHAIGFLMAEENSDFFKHVSDIARRSFNNGKYQSIGSDIFNNSFKSIESIKQKSPHYDPIFLDQDCVYNIDCDNILKFYNEDLPCPEGPGIIGFHWYAGHPMAQKFEKLLTKDNFKEQKATISNIIKKALDV